MKQLLFLVRIFCAWLALFFVGKLIFFAYNGFPAGGDFLQIIWHGLSLDLSVAAYATAPIWLATWIGHFWKNPTSEKIGSWFYRIYTSTLLTIFLMIIIIDTIIYKSWGFKLDAVALSYLDNPSSIPESLGWGFVILAFLLFVGIVAGVSWLFWKLPFLPKLNLCLLEKQLRLAVIRTGVAVISCSNDCVFPSCGRCSAVCSF